MKFILFLFLVSIRLFGECNPNITECLGGDCGMMPHSNGPGACFSDSGCTNPCTPCGMAMGCNGSCGGAGYSPDWGATCFSDNSCLNSCGSGSGSGSGGLPEMPLVMRGLIPFFVIAGTAFLIRRRKREKK